MEICICLCGQLRGKLSSLHDSYNKIIENDKINNYTIIFSIWEKSSEKIDFQSPGQLDRVFDKTISSFIPYSYYKNGIFNYLNSAKEYLVRFSNNSNEVLKFNLCNSIIDIETENLDLHLDEQREDKNTFKMLYKRWRCNEIKKKIERKNKKKFDMVLITRPDALFEINHTLLDSNFDKNPECIYIPGFNINPHGYANDLYAYGSSESIDKYVELFKKCIGNDIDYIHNELYHHLESNFKKIKNSHHIENFNINNGNSIGLKEIYGDNDFFDFLVDINEKKHTNPITFNKEETAIINRYRCLNDIQSNNVYNFELYLNSDICFYNTIRNIKNIYDGHLEIIKEFIDLKPIEIKNDIIYWGSDEFKVNHTSRENIKSLLSNEKVKNKNNLKKIIFYIENSLWDELSFFIESTSCPDHFATLIGKYAIENENKSFQTSLF